MGRRQSKATAVTTSLAAFLALLPLRAQEAPVNPLDEHTALTVGARKLKLGVLAFEYGVTDRLSVGTDPPAWALRTAVPVLVPNLHVKGVFARLPPAILTGQIGAYYANIGVETASGQLLLVPLTLLSTSRIASNTWLHLEGNYNWVRGFGAGDLSRTEVAGALAMRTAQVGAMIELRLSRVVALLARGRYQAYASPLVLSGGSSIDPYTRVDVSLEAQPAQPHPAVVVAGAAFTWTHVGLVVGGGFGHYFIPGVNLALPDRGFTPEGSLWAIF
jgi:hypothetical protein